MTIHPSQSILDAVLNQALDKTVVEIERFIKSDSTSPVPVYDPSYYGYPRKTGRTEQLRMSGTVERLPGGYGITVDWSAPYARHLEEKGRSCGARARKPGTTTEFRSIVLKELARTFILCLREYLLRNSVGMEQQWS